MYKMEEDIRKMRRTNRLLQKMTRLQLDFGELAESLSGEMEGDVYIVDKNGTLLGHGRYNRGRCQTIEKEILHARCFSEDFNQWLCAIGHSLINYRDDEGNCIFDEDNKCDMPDEVAMVVPILSSGTRLGSLVFVKSGEEFNDGDILMGECAAVAIGMKIIHKENEQSAKELRQETNIRMALDALSYSEIKAVKHIFDEIGSDRGFLVASKVADNMGITRSVVINALRKLESAGVIESKSLGMKGTYIRATNKDFLDALDDAL